MSEHVSVRCDGCGAMSVSPNDNNGGQWLIVHAQTRFHAMFIGCGVSTVAFDLCNECAKPVRAVMEQVGQRASVPK